MRFSLRSILYVIALLTAAFAACGPIGFLLAIAVALFWIEPFLVLKILTRTEWLIMYFVIFVLIGFLISPGPRSRGAAKHNSCLNNMKQLGLALQNYEAKYEIFPPAYVKDANGKRLHSWRTLIMPQMELTTMYSAYLMSEAWNGPSNNKLSKIPLIEFRCPSVEEEQKLQTNYFAVIDDKTAFNEGLGTKVEEFVDGAWNTLLFMEVHGRGVNWSEPNDLTFDEAVEILTTKDIKKSGCVHRHVGKTYLGAFRFESPLIRSITLVDGTARHIPISISQEDAIALLTKAGGEDFDIGSLVLSNRENWVIIWKQVYALTMLVIVIFLPIPWAIRYHKKQRKNWIEKSCN